MKKIILNQKSYMNLDQMIEFKKKYSKVKSSNYELILFPPIMYLSMFNKETYKVGTQNFFSYNEGSFTGEISLKLLKYLGINYTLVGSYERKKIIEESYSIIKEKLYKSLKSKFNTILFVGEQKKIRTPFNYIKKELNYYLRDIESDNLKYLTIAYEPSWTIGIGDIIDIEKINKTISKIKKYVWEKYIIDIDVYYAGNIDEDNVKEIMDISNGIVLGKQSTDIKNIISYISILDK